MDRDRHSICLQTTIDDKCTACRRGPGGPGNTCLAASAATLLSLPTQAALYSTTKVEALYGWDYEDRADAGFGIDNERHGILTIANSSGWTYGDVYFFADFTDCDRGTNEEQDYGSTHAEFNLRGNIGKVLGQDLSFGPVSNLYLNGQIDMDRNSATRKTAHMVGLDDTDESLPQALVRWTF